MQTLNKTIFLFLHSNGAFYPSINQLYVRKLWKNGFTSPRNKIYNQSLSNNKTDISFPFRRERLIWYNGIFISKRAFYLIPEQFLQKL